MELLLEFYKSAREEILIRVKSRDNLIKLQLLVQAILFGMTEGVKLGGVEAKTAMPYVTFLSVPISLIFWLLYFTENRLIGQIGTYNRNLINKYNDENETSSKYQCWDGSDELLEYMQIRRLSHLFVQLVVFFLIPSLLLYRYYLNLKIWKAAFDLSFILEVIGLLIILLLIIGDFIYRTSKARKMKLKIKKENKSNEQQIEKI